jgi:hypothetical protein
MQTFPKWALWLGGALAWVAGVSLALFALAAPARSEIAFTPEGARLVCAGTAPESLKGQGNALHLPAPTAAQMSACRVEFDFALRDPSLATRVVASAYVELVGLKRVRAAFPERLAVNGPGLALTARPGGGLTLAVALETLLGGDRQRGAALILALRDGDGEAAQTYWSPTLLIERTDSPALLRAKRTGN